MTWLAWRQFRPWALVAALGAAALALLLWVMGHHLAVLFAANGVPSCAGQQDCGAAASNFLSAAAGGQTHLVFLIGIAATYSFPALAGMFWGAPMVTGEMERGTYRFAWTQSITRRRWLAVKLAVAGLATVASAGLLTFMVSRWPSLIDRASSIAGSAGGFNANRFAPALFGAGGVVPVAAAAFGFLLGVAIGVLVRRTLPAMALTLAAVVVSMMAMGLLAPHLIPPQRSVIAARHWNVVRAIPHGSVTAVTVAAPPGAWVLSEATLDGGGHRVGGVPAALVPAGGGCTATEPGPYATCLPQLGQLGYTQSVTFQPPSRYWPLQWAVAALYAAGVLVLLLFLRRSIVGVQP